MIARHRTVNPAQNGRGRHEKANRLWPEIGSARVAEWTRHSASSWKGGGVKLTTLSTTYPDDQVAEAADSLRAAITAALSPDSLLVEDQLRQELGRDISLDSGS